MKYCAFLYMGHKVYSSECYIWSCSLEGKFLPMILLMACVTGARLVWRCVGRLSVRSLQACLGSQQAQHQQSVRSSFEEVLELGGGGDGDSVPRDVWPQPRHYTTSLQRNSSRQKTFTAQIQLWGSSLRPCVRQDDKWKDWWKILSGTFIRVVLVERKLAAEKASPSSLWSEKDTLKRKPSPQQVLSSNGCAHSLRSRGRTERCW